MANNGNLTNMRDHLTEMQNEDHIAATAEQERGRRWEESGMKRTPSDILGDAVLDNTSHQLVPCQQGCAGEGFCMIDTMRQAFGIHDGDTVMQALEGKLTYITSEAVDRLQEYADAVAQDIKRDSTENYIAIDVLAETNDIWCNMDMADFGDWSQYKAQMLFADVEREIGYF